MNQSYSKKENDMQIQINTGHNIQVHEALAAEVNGIVESALSRFSDHITRVEVHLSDENSAKKVGHDTMRCVMEVRLKGRQPIAVSHQAATKGEAITAAADKLSSLIEHTLGRQRHQERRQTDPDPSPLELEETP
jgi:ribosomal subunit interface protein